MQTYGISLTMESLKDLFFDEPEFGSVSVSDMNVERSWDNSEDPQEWELVRARVQNRDVMLYNEGIYKVYKYESCEPLVEEPVETLTESEILDRMPKNLRDRYVVPSPSGEYITVVEVVSRENEDGTIRLETKGQTRTIPVEFVKERLTYDEVIVELIDV